MADERTNGGRAYQIDFPVLWYLLRGAQILFAVVFVKLTYLSLRTDSFAESLISFVGMLLMIEVFVHGVATGTADSAGIRYRRYFRWKIAAWNDVLQIQWVRSRLKVLIRGRGKRKRTLVFLLDPLKSEAGYLAHRLGGEAAPPEILARIHALQVEMPPGIASAPPYSKWILRLFLGIGILFVLVLLWRLLAATAPVPR
jgi:hypothetical protein